MLITEITQRDWSLSTTAQGEIAQGLRDISQCIYIIVTTVKGSDPLRPEFGADIKAYLDQPASQVPALIRAITQAIEIWETRVRVTRVSYKIENSYTIKFQIEWTTIAGTNGDTTVIL
jgi:phage baseplate assembly protein W